MAKTKGMFRITAHTWFASLSHSDRPLELFHEDRAWARAHCKPIPELTTSTVKTR